MAKVTKPVGEYLIKDIKTRMESGKKTYGKYLFTDNGRDAILDLYEELMDACFYIKQFMLERDLRERLLASTRPTSFRNFKKQLTNGINQRTSVKRKSRSSNKNKPNGRRSRSLRK